MNSELQVTKWLDSQAIDGITMHKGDTLSVEWNRQKVAEVTVDSDTTVSEVAFFEGVVNGKKTIGCLLIE